MHTKFQSEYLKGTYEFRDLRLRVKDKVKVKVKVKQR
jgi:hypothetical protein